VIGLGTIGVEKWGEGSNRPPFPLGSYLDKFENIRASLKVKTFFILFFRDQTNPYNTNFF